VFYNYIVTWRLKSSGESDGERIYWYFHGKEKREEGKKVPGSRVDDYTDSDHCE